MVATCRICLEPIYHFICAECLFRNIKLWLERNASYLLGEAEEAHQRLVETFSGMTGNTELCAVCKKVTEIVFCPYCYIREMYLHLREFDAVRAEQLVRILNFDFEGTGYFRDFEPNPTVLALEEKIEEGICDECGNEAEELFEFNGRFICETCLEYEDDRKLMKSKI
ncbi:MAG: hypothetical protein DRP11_03780 [Candidatus Aenigmatarchaeota archaeon]|nr:MAG: hypothetical protein DRP11_03780 [Candidatus Aenigmarchaeota archaeon]